MGKISFLVGAEAKDKDRKAVVRSVMTLHSVLRFLVVLYSFMLVQQNT